LTPCNTKALAERNGACFKQSDSGLSHAIPAKAA
jgi:hypothetical protein